MFDLCLQIDDFGNGAGVLVFPPHVNFMIAPTRFFFLTRTKQKEDGVGFNPLTLNQILLQR